MRPSRVLLALSLASLGAVAVLGGSCKGLLPGIGICTATSDCDTGQVCIAGSCGKPGSVATGGTCTATRDCAAGDWCEPILQCATAGTGMVGDLCSSDGACTPGLRCDLVGFSGSCAMAGTKDFGDSCTTTSDCLAGLFCGAGNKCNPYPLAFPPFAGVMCADAEATFRGYFEVPRPSKPPADFYRLPYPSDVRVDSTGKVDMSDFPLPGPTPLGPDLVKLYVDAFTTDFDGFSSSSVVTFRFSSEMDFSTTSGDTIKYVDVTGAPTDAGFGRQLAIGWSYSTGKNKFACENRLTVRADLSEPLLPGHRYAVVLSTGIKSKNGDVAASQDTDLTAVLGATRPTGDDALGRAWDTYQPVRDVLPKIMFTTDQVASATIFTVADTTGHMQRLADDVAKQPAPVLKSLVLCDTGVTSPCDDGTPARACPAANSKFFEIHGKFSVPIYQQGTPPYLKPADGGGITEVAGIPQLVRTEDVCFALAIPKAGTMPAGGWPLVVYGHGTGGSMRSFIDEGLADKITTAATPAAMFGFDAVEHGARRGASTEKPDNLVFNALNPRAARDNFLQGAVDTLQAFRVAGISLDMGTSPTGAAIAFDASKLIYFGHSQGSTSGEMAVAVSPAVQTAVFSGAGAFLSASLLEKTSPVDIKDGMAFLIGEQLDGGHPIIVLFQSFFERSDPLNYVPLLIKRPAAGVNSKNVYMSYGLMDTFSPSGTLQHNASAMGLQPVAPILEDFSVAAINRPVSLNKTGGDGVKRTAAVFQYTPTGFDGHFVAIQLPAAVTDWTAFLQSWLTTGTATIP